MGNDHRKLKKAKKREEKKRDSLDRLKLKKGITASERKQGTYQIYLLIGFVVVTAAFVFYRMT